MKKAMHRFSPLLTAGVIVTALVPFLMGCAHEEVLFLVDSSSSMTSSAQLNGESDLTRWDMLQIAFPQWLDRFPPGAVGVVDVGGSCGDSPRQEYAIGTSHRRLTEAVAGTMAGGETNLNRMLEKSIEYFDAPRGKRRVVILSDGGNTCPPQRSTCDIARALHRVHGVQIDAVLFKGEAGMEDEYRCIVKATSGRMIIPDSKLGWKNIELRMGL